VITVQREFRARFRKNAPCIVTVPHVNSERIQVAWAWYWNNSVT